jgi:spermidine/putrescine-binding protein
MIVSVRLFFDALAGAGSFAENAMATPIRFMALLGTVMLLCAVTAEAQQKTFFVAGYGGAFEQSMRKEIIPVFEKKHGVQAAGHSR